MPLDDLIRARWIPLAVLSLANLSRLESGAVYGIRHSVTHDLLYIGSAADLRRRLFGEYIGGAGGAATRRVHELLFGEGGVASVEVAWVAAVDHRRAADAIVQAYQASNEGRLPPWNSASPLRIAE